MGHEALIYVVPHNRAVSQHVSEMMYGFGSILSVVPAACLREEGIRNQRAHQGSESDEEVESLQKGESRSQRHNVLHSSNSRLVRL